ncbi:hypothetical protein WICMUC_003221 [Wickerhamomyces mucosus]|uniref:N-glycosylase/DNA lyase n=1 Tax=Wickerhamomyces mucosus TaxID=1378264 RepID=A0A9P8PNB2_9ASCO|nr:hypothetical protein WICMUC_003221 [Wickerhamomyces mucosus]
MVNLIWESIKVSPSELSLSKVLRCGQAFRWKNIGGVWSCSLGPRVVFLRQDNDDLHYSSYPQTDKLSEIIKDYFQLDVKVSELYKLWKKTDTNFNKNCVGFEGVRMLRQDPWENTISFICSSNNNVKRISSMCNNLCLHFGRYILNHEGVDYYEFPSPDKLSPSNAEQKLRDLGFGYRAKYIQKTARMIHESKQDLSKLRNLPYEETHSELLKFTGVGPKVADCICLMSMDKNEAIPVDTHVYQIAKRDYKLKMKGETVTKENYALIKKFFIEKWGPYAGWAQSVLFAADLKDLNNGINQVKAKEIVKINGVKTEKGLKRTVNTDIKIEIETKNSIKIETEEEIEYSNTGRIKRRKTAKAKSYH